MTKYNKSEIMRHAHAIRKRDNVSMSIALTKAWNSAKLPRFVDGSAKTINDLTSAFLTKNPRGTIKVDLDNCRHTSAVEVQYYPNGKVYTYMGHPHNVAHKLGISIPKW